MKSLAPLDCKTLHFETLTDFQSWRASLPTGSTVGFVPTMGALHAGHEALLRQSAEENDYSVLSIFVNPTQFNQADDFQNYPKTLDHDLNMAIQTQTSCVWMPPRETLYPDDYQYQVIEKSFSKELCGIDRPGHFEGVMTVVLKLLNITQATRAYFGEKDYQQLKLIQDMAAAFFVPTKIIACPTVREPSGLALSSRNLRLTSAEKEIAPKLYEVLKTTKDLESGKAQLNELGFKVDYLVETHGRRFVAAWLGKVRLIDNVSI